MSTAKKIMDPSAYVQSQEKATTSGAGYILSKLVEPAADLRSSEQRREARLLSSLLIFLIPQAMVSVVAVLLADPNFKPLNNPFFYVASITIVVFIIGYILSRTTRYILGAALVVGFLPLLIFASVLSPAASIVSVIGILIWQTMVVLVGSIFFSVRYVAILAAATIGGTFLLPLLGGKVGFEEILVPQIFNSIVSTLILVAARHRNMVELDRQAQLAESETRYRTLLETGFDGIILHDNERIVDANPGFADMFGYSPEEVIGMQLASFAIRGAGNTQIANEMLTGSKLVHEWRATRKDGTEFHIEIVGRPQLLYGADVQMIAIRDISERKRAELAERNERVLAEALRDTAAALNSTLNLEEVLERILKNIGRVVPHDAANIMLIKQDIIEVVRCRSYVEGNLEKAMLGMRIPLANMPALNRMVTTANPPDEPGANGHSGWVDIPETSWLRSHLAAPIRLEGKVIGFLNLGSAADEYFTHQHAEQLQLFAEQATMAIHNANLYEKLGAYSESLEYAVEERTAELKQSEEQTQAILHNSPDAISVLNAEGKFQTGNRAFYQLFKFEVGEFFEKSPTELVQQDYADTFQNALSKVYESGKPTRFEVVAQRSSGTTFDAEIALAPIKIDANRVVGVVCGLRDVSAQKEVERMKDAFVSSVSHELRTPVTSIKLNLMMIGRNPEKQPVYMELLEREIDRLSHIIEGLLHLSRLDQQGLSLTMAPTNLNLLAREYVSDRTPLFENHEISLSHELSSGLPEIDADKGLLGQVLSILLTNANNYTPSGGHVVVRTQVRKEADKLWAGFSVSDDGPGIPDEEQLLLFQRFYRGKLGRESGNPGTGLGLAIASQIIEQHNGYIEVTSEGISGKGTTFTVWLQAQDTAVH